MKFVDEFRDPDVIAKTAEEIRRLADPARHYRLMEVCGGHTHAIYRFGLKDILPANIELIHGPGCPVCVLPMGRIDDGLALAQDPNVIFAAFGDMMRVPGEHGSPLEHKARGMDVRIVYSPSDALKLAKANPDKHVMFFAIGFETTAPSSALTIMRAKAEGIHNFSVFCNHVTIIPAIRAILDSPDMRLDAFIGPGHVSTVIGCRPYEWIAANERKPIVVSGFEPLDMLQSIVMLLRQLEGGRSEGRKSVQASCALGRESRCSEGDGRSVRTAALFRMARFGIYFAIGAAHSQQLRRVGFRAAIQRAWRARDRSQGGAVRRSVERRVEARAVQAVRQGMYAGTSGGRVDGFLGGIVRSLLQLRTSEGNGRDAGMAGVMPAVADSTLPKIKFREPQIEMAHGAGGIASRRLVEGLFAPLLYRSAQPQLNDAASLNIGGVRLAMTTDSFVVKPLSFPGGSIGELAINGTVNDLAVSGAKAEAIVVSFILEAGLPTPTLEAEVRAMARAAEEAGVSVVGGDTKVVEHGKADGMYISTTGVGSYLPGIRIDARSVRPGDKVLLSGPIGDHGITILLARGELDFEADLRSDTRSIFPLVQAMAAEAAPGIRWMRDPTRGGAATSLNELARDCGLGIHIFEEEIPVHDTVRGACELLGLDPLHIANEGQFLAVVSPEYADAALNALQQTIGGEGAVMLGEVHEQPAGSVLVTTRYGGSRIIDMLVGDPLPRIC